MEHDVERPIRISAPLPGWLAIALVTGTSAAVLVLEILAGRLLAPYIGVSLETFTGIIGTILAGIALGAWAGGVIADSVDPRRLLPLLLMLGGALAIATIPIVRLLGDELGSSGGASIIALSAFGFLPAAAVLSAVPPAVVKLQLRDLSTTGTTVGRLSAWSTGGAIVGTFLTGFVLVAWAAVSTLIVATGLVLVAVGVALWFTTALRSTNQLLSVAVLAGLSLAGVATVDEPCDTQTAYYCASVRDDPSNASGRVLVLDTVRHSYVDLDDPTVLEFWYIRRIVDAIELFGPNGSGDIVYLGGGGLTIPRYIQATSPDTDQTVLEIDRDLVDLVESDLGFERGERTDIVIGDGRLSLADRPTASADVVVGDAFGSRTVPWHLATQEFMEEIARVLKPGGIYAANMIDSPARSLVRAEAATMAQVWPHVVVVFSPAVADGFSGNSVIIASDEPIDEAGLAAALSGPRGGGRIVDDLEAFLDGATLLTDDYAPVDQLLAGSL